MGRATKVLEVSGRQDIPAEVGVVHELGHAGTIVDSPALVDDPFPDTLDAPIIKRGRADKGFEGEDAVAGVARPRVTCVANAVSVSVIGLIGVGHAGTVVAVVADAITVIVVGRCGARAIDDTLHSDGEGTGVSRAGDPVAIRVRVTRVTGFIAVEIGLTLVELGRTIVVRIAHTVVVGVKKARRSHAWVAGIAQAVAIAIGLRALNQRAVVIPVEDAVAVVVVVT